MSKEIPRWADYYAIGGTNKTRNIWFFDSKPHTLVVINGESCAVKPIENLAKDLAIANVCKQIKDKPLHSRIDVIGQNGNDGLVYEQKRSKYHREIKPGVWVDVYDVLNAFGVKCHALAHAIKKLLMPGERGAKGYKQDCEEAIQSVKRSIDEWG